MTQKKERIAWADICKGLLITLLMFHHLAWISHRLYNIDNNVISQLGEISSIWTCFFMSCFFIISGMFSNFNKPAKTFLLGNFKSLIIPAWISLVLLSLPGIACFDVAKFANQAILYGGGLWFLCALFFSKISLWISIKWLRNKWLILGIFMVLSFLGKVLDDANMFPNYWYHRNFLNFAFFLGLGYYFKDLIQRKSVGVVSVIVFVLTIIICFIINVRVPSVVAIFNETIAQHPLTILLSITGSISCIHLCKLIKNNVVLEYLGRNSLIVYIYHMFILHHTIIALTSSLNEGTITNSLIMIFMIVGGTLLFCSAIAEVMDKKCFRWMKGVF